MNPVCVDQAVRDGVTDRLVMAEAFYQDVVLVMGEAPGQREAFEVLLQYLEPSDPVEVWHVAMVGFGLGLAEDQESRQFVTSAASGFLMI